MRRQAHYKEEVIRGDIKEKEQWQEVVVAVCVTHLNRFIGGIAVNRIPPKYGSSVLSKVR